jgi:hypothetical protein
MSEQELQAYRAEVEAVKEWWKVSLLPRPLSPSSPYPYPQSPLPTLNLTNLPIPTPNPLLSLPNPSYVAAPPFLPRQTKLYRRRGRQQARHPTYRLPLQRHGQEDVGAFGE